MIRVTRSTEPAALRDARDQHLPAARAAVGAGAPVAFVAYDVGKTALFEAQHSKCCYCEKREEQAKYRDVEHYRPKAPYWWLAWTWENLLFSCVDCNREHKRNQFPLRSGSVRLIAEQAPPGAEEPLVLDPASAATDPLTEIRFQRATVGGIERWTPCGQTERGDETIRVCGLDRPALVDLYSAHVRDFVRPRVDAVVDAHRRGDEPGVQGTWRRAIKTLFALGQPFQQLSYDAVDVLVHAATREEHRLDLPPPR